MKTVLMKSFDEMMATIRAGKEIPVPDRIRYRFESSQVVRRCAALCDELMPLLGGRAIYMDSPVVHYWLDINAARARPWRTIRRSSVLRSAPCMWARTCRSSSS